MAREYDPDSTADLLAQAEALNAENKELLGEIRKARSPGFNQPQDTLRKLARDTRQKDPKSEFRVGPNGIFKDFGHFMGSVRQVGSNNQNWDSNEPMKNYLTKAIPSGMNIQQAQDGGFLVPPEFVNQLLMRTYSNDLLSRTTMFPMTTSNALKIPAVNETSRADGSRFGGVQAYWDGEGNTINASKPSLAQVTLTANRLTMAIRATQELLDDTSALETWMNLIADQELAFKIGDGLVNGTGAGMPLGMQNALSLVSVAKETGQAAATLVAQNVLKMWSRLHISCMQNAVWLYDQSILPQLQSMTIGTAGAQLAVFLPQGGLSQSPYATLQGRPMIPVEFCQTLGTAGDLILVDPATIVSAMKGGMQAMNSLHVYFLSNEQVFRFVMRVDARSWWTSAITPKSAGSTQTNIVNLATR
jgi:HK97 family phage major capsid protein